MRLNYDSCSAVLSEAAASENKKRRGNVGIVLDGGWGEVGITKITDAEAIGPDPLYREDAICGIADVLKSAEAVYVCRPVGGSYASSVLGRAKYEGAAGNSIIIVCDAVSGDVDCYYDVTTYADKTAVDRQRVRTMNELSDNEYVIFDREAEIFATAGLPMTGGNDCEMTKEKYAECLSMFDLYDVDVLACVDTAAENEREFVNYIVKRRARGDVIYGVSSTVRDLDGIVSVYFDGADTAFMVPFTAGIVASTPFYKSINGTLYEGVREPLAYDDVPEDNIPKNGIVYIRCRDGVYAYCEDEELIKSREAQEIGKRIRRVFTTKYADTVTDGERGLLRLRNDIKGILDGICDAYGSCRIGSFDISTDGNGNIAVKLTLSSLKRPENIRINALIYPL